MSGWMIKRQMKGRRGGREKDTVVLSSGHRVIHDNCMSLNYEVALYFSQEYSNLGVKYLLLINQVLYLTCPITGAALSFAQNVETGSESLSYS